MNKKSLFLLIKISIPVLIIGGGFGVEKYLNKKAQNVSKETVVVCEDNATLPQVDEKPLEVISKKSYGNIEGLSGNAGFYGDNEAVVTIGMSKEEFNNIYIKGLKESDGKKAKELFQKYNNEISGNLYKLNLSNLDKTILSKENMQLISVVPDKKLGSSKIDFRNSTGEYLCDFKDGNIIKFRDKDRRISEVEVYWSEDSNCRITYGYGELEVYNLKDNSIKCLKINRNDLNINTTDNPKFYSEDGKIIYVTASQNKDINLVRKGIFKINVESGKIEEVFALPYIDSKSVDNGNSPYYLWGDYYVIDGGKKILFTASINKKSGIFMYSVLENKLNCVVSDENTYCKDFWLSPDKTKVIYEKVVIENRKEKSAELYGAKINGNNFTSKICLYKDIRLVERSGFKSVQWSADSNKILFFTLKNEMKTTGYYEMTYNAENEVNVITFK